MAPCSVRICSQISNLYTILIKNRRTQLQTSEVALHVLKRGQRILDDRCFPSGSLNLENACCYASTWLRRVPLVSIIMTLWFRKHVYVMLAAQHVAKDIIFGATSYHSFPWSGNFDIPPKVNELHDFSASLNGYLWWNGSVILDRAKRFSFESRWVTMCSMCDSICWEDNLSERGVTKGCYIGILYGWGACKWWPRRIASELIWSVYISERGSRLPGIWKGICRQTMKLSWNEDPTIFTIVFQLIHNRSRCM